MDFLIAKADTYKTKALQLGDHSTAMKLAWLKNSMEYAIVDEDSAFQRLFEIVSTGK